MYRTEEEEGEGQQETLLTAQQSSMPTSGVHLTQRETNTQTPKYLERLQRVIEVEKQRGTGGNLRGKTQQVKVSETAKSSSQKGLH